MRPNRPPWSQIGHRIPGECVISLGECPADEVRSRPVVRRQDVAVGVQRDRHVGVSEPLAEGGQPSPLERLRYLSMGSLVKQPSVSLTI